MKTKQTFRELFGSAKTTIPYKVETVVLDVTDQIVTRMNQLGVNRSSLASKIDSSPAYVTKFLAGGTNFTVESLVKLSEALDAELKIEIIPKTPVHAWIDLIEKSTRPPKIEQTIFSRWRLRKQGDEQPRFIGSSHDFTLDKSEEMYNY